MGQRKKGKEKEIDGAEKDRGQGCLQRQRENDREEETARGFGGDYCMCFIHFSAAFCTAHCERDTERETQ